MLTTSRQIRQFSARQPRFARAKPKRGDMLHFPYRNTASFSLQDKSDEHCFIFLIETLKDFEAVCALLVSNQRPELCFQPCARVGDDREVKEADALLHVRPSQLIFDTVKTRQLRHPSIERAI